MQNPHTLTLPFAWEDKKALIYERMLIIPQKGDVSYFTLPPLSDSTLFGNHNDVVVEYCSGNGSWIATKAKNNPDKNFLAVEMCFDRARKIWKKIHAHNLPNLVVAWAEGLQLTRDFLPKNTISEIYINFPDPWPKRRHAKYRIINKPFLDELHKILKIDGTITVVTDDEGFSDWTISHFLNHPGLLSTISEPYFKEPPADYGSSFFEELWKSKGKTIRFHQAKKKNG